jgi:hypothetical protein
MNLGFYEVQVTSSLAEELLTFQDGLCAMELISLLVPKDLCCISEHYGVGA